MLLLSLRRSLGRLAADETANALPEYAIVMAAVTIISMLAFESLAGTSSNVVVTNQNNLSATGSQSYVTP